MPSNWTIPISAWDSWLRCVSLNRAWEPESALGSGVVRLPSSLVGVGAVGKEGGDCGRMKVERGLMKR
jgi:hypothetical protein